MNDNNEVVHINRFLHKLNLLSQLSIDPNEQWAYIEVPPELASKNPIKSSSVSIIKERL